MANRYKSKAELGGSGAITTGATIRPSLLRVPNRFAGRAAECRWSLLVFGLVKGVIGARLLGRRATGLFGSFTRYR